MHTRTDVQKPKKKEKKMHTKAHTETLYDMGFVKNTPTLTFYAKMA